MRSSFCNLSNLIPRTRPALNEMAGQMTYHTFVDYQSHPTFPGLIVPQQVYGQNVPFARRPPIRFAVNGRPGISLSDALAERYQGLAASTSTPDVTETSMRVAMRILWPGYDQWSQTVHAYDHSASARPYSLAKLANVTARTVKKFLDDMRNVQSTEARPDWWVHYVPFESLYLVELRHVSSGSWQPVLCRAV